MSFGTEAIIFFRVFTKYPYMPDIKLFHLITKQILKIFKNNKYLFNKEYKNT